MRRLTLAAPPRFLKRPVTGRRSPGVLSMLLLIDNYDSVTYNLVHFLGELGVRCTIYRNDAITVQDAIAFNPAIFASSPASKS